jgi:signal transduction histidine kinase
MKKFAVLVFYLFIIILSASSQTKVDSLLQLCNNASEKQKTNLFLELSFNTRTDSAKSISYAMQALRLAEEQKQIPQQAKSFYYIGETIYYKRNYAEAIPYYQKAIPLFEQIKDSLNIYDCQNAIGLCYHYMFQGEKAIARFITALKYCEKDPERTANLYSNIGMVHSRMNNFKDAIDNYRKSLKINLSIHDTASIAVNYNGLGDTFSWSNMPDSALVNFLKSYHYFKLIRLTDRQAIVMSNLASVYSNYPDSLNKALNYFDQAWNRFQKLGWNHYEAEIRQGIASIYRKQGKYKEAIVAYNESLRLTDLFNRGFSLKKVNYEGLADVYEKMGDYKKALQNYALYNQYNDSMVQKEKYEQIISLEKQYETEKKQNEIIRLQSRQELMDIQLQKNKQLKILGFVTASLLLIFILFILVRYFDKIKLNQLLEHKNRQIEQSENELRTLNAAKNKFFSIIAHDLKNPFHTVMGYSYLLSNDYKLFTEEERRKFASDIHHSTNNIFRLLQNLLEWSKAQTGRLIFTPCEVELKKIIENSVSVLRSLANQKNIRIEFYFDDDLKLFADPQMIETVLRNLISNAIKFTPENGLIEIMAHQIENKINICVKDSGIGISEEDAHNLFQIDSTVKRKGTNDEDGSGLGLILCKEFVQKNNGTIWVNSSPVNGSSFFFTIPATIGKSHQSLDNDSSQQLS